MSRVRELCEPNTSCKSKNNHVDINLKERGGGSKCTVRYGGRTLPHAHVAGLQQHQLRGGGCALRGSGAQLPRHAAGRAMMTFGLPSCRVQTGEASKGRHDTTKLIASAGACVPAFPMQGPRSDVVAWTAPSGNVGSRLCRNDRLMPQMATRLRGSPLVPLKFVEGLRIVARVDVHRLAKRPLGTCLHVDAVRHDPRRRYSWHQVVDRDLRGVEAGHAAVPARASTT